MNMETMISFLILTALGIGLGITVLTVFVNRKVNRSIQQLVKQGENTLSTSTPTPNGSNYKIEDSVLDNIKTELKVVAQGLEYYKKESQHWYQAYQKECTVRQNLEDEIKIIKREVGILHYIVDKMDGKVIERDEYSNINKIRVVK